MEAVSAFPQGVPLRPGMLFRHWTGGLEEKLEEGEIVLSGGIVREAVFSRDAGTGKLRCRCLSAWRGEMREASDEG